MSSADDIVLALLLRCTDEEVTDIYKHLAGVTFTRKQCKDRVQVPVPAHCSKKVDCIASVLSRIDIEI